MLCPETNDKNVFFGAFGGIGTPNDVIIFNQFIAWYLRFYVFYANRRNNEILGFYLSLFRIPRIEVKNSTVVFGNIFEDWG